MEIWEFVCLVVLIFTTITLIIKQMLIKKDLKNINNQLEEIINGDTNSLIKIESNSREIKRFANSINSKLSIIRKKEISLNARNTEIGNEITNISHDIRTPLTSIKGYLDLLKNETDIENIKKYLGIIDERTQSMKKLTDELFQYSILMTENEIKTESLILNNALEDAIAAEYTLLTSKNITPEIHICEKAISILADKDHLSRIFVNIISNAAKYSEGDLIVSLDESGEIEFKNTATGIDEIQAGQLFDRFFTVSNAKNATGIGLSIAKKFTEDMGGTISSSLKNNQLSIKIKFKQT